MVIVTGADVWGAPQFATGEEMVTEYKPGLLTDILRVVSPVFHK
jgi:hypothetical protein